MADLQDYLGLVTSAHRDKPRYTAQLAALAGCLADLQQVYAAMPERFDLDRAVGAQQDDVGRWVGIGRAVRTPIEGVYFAFDQEGVGLDQGIWRGRFDPESGVSLLDDDTFRLLMRAKIGANHWDGTMEGSTPVFEAIFQAGTHVFVQDNQDMSMDVGLSGTAPSALFVALLTRGYIPIKPVGVRVKYYLIPSGDGPQFGFDVGNQYISGFDAGLWGKLISM